VPSPDPSPGTAFDVRGDRVAVEDAGFRAVVDVVDRFAVALVDETAALGFGAAAFAAVDLAAAGFVAAGLAAAGFARARDRATVGGLSSLIWAVSWTTSARASDACFFRFASTSRALWRRFSSRASSFDASLAALLGPAVPAD